MEQSAWTAAAVAGAGAAGIWLFRVASRKRARIPLPALSRRVAVVTGANSGIGSVPAGLAAATGRDSLCYSPRKKVAEELAANGARVVLACRSKKRAQKAAASIATATGCAPELLHPAEVDVSDMASVRAFADRCTAEWSGLHILINNAGVMLTTRQENAQGMELTLATNYYGPFLLIHSLLPLLKDDYAPHVINVGSRLEKRGTPEPVDGLEKLPGEYSLGHAYAVSKCALLSFTFELARREPGLMVLNVTPGMVKTNLSRFVPNWVRTITAPLQWLLLRSPQQGANAILRAATAGPGEIASGSYVGDDLVPVTGVSAASQDPELARQLWKSTSDVVGLSSGERS